MRHAIAAVALSVALAGCGSSQPQAGTVDPDGQVGALRLDHSTPEDIRRVAGRPDFDGVGSFDAPGFPPLYDALGYDCSRRPVDGIDPGAYQATRTYCMTVYFVNPRTGRLAAFWTDSPTFRTRRGSRPGMKETEAVRRERSPVRVGPFPGIIRETRAAELIMETTGCSLKIPCGKGRVEAFALESNAHPVGLLFE